MSADRSPGLPLYERSVLPEATGGPLRPGGLELTGELLDRAGLAAGASLLDVGCGSGASCGLARERGLEATGLDASPGLLAQARSRCPRLILADAARLPLADARFDAVLCECVLWLAPDPGRVLAEMGRVLKPGGVLLLSDLYVNADAAPASGTGCVSRARSLAELEELLRGQRFYTEFFQDRSRDLVHLAARLVFAHGRDQAQALLAGTVACPGSASARPGYFALAARKKVASSTNGSEAWTNS